VAVCPVCPVQYAPWPLITAQTVFLRDHRIERERPVRLADGEKIESYHIELATELIVHAPPTPQNITVCLSIRSIIFRYLSNCDRPPRWANRVKVSELGDAHLNLDDVLVIIVAMEK
jgi:hypothetical protein